MFVQNLQKLVAAVDASLATWSGVKKTMFHSVKLVESVERIRPARARWLPPPTLQRKNVEKKKKSKSTLCLTALQQPKIKDAPQN